MTKNPLKAYIEDAEDGLSKLASDLGVSRWTLWRWAKGTKPVSLKHVDHVSDVTGIPVPELRPDLVKKFGGREA
jgi:DNA-binding transcriptional regulator YdaS (Cro superfamily)